MASPVDSESPTKDSEFRFPKPDDLCETISQLIRNKDTKATPVISVVGVGSVDDMQVCDTSDKINDDELDDLVEEQLVLNKIKEMQSTRRNLGINRLQMNRSGFDQITVVQDGNDDDSDSLFNFTAAGSSGNDDRRHKEDLNRLSKALTINIVMQSELTKLEIFLVEKLKENRRKQLEIKNETSEAPQNIDKTSSKWKTQSLYSKFGMPYFKDKRKFSSNLNSDFRKMKSLDQLLSTNVNPSRMWRLKEKALLEEGIRRLLVEENTAELLTQEVKLKEELHDSTFKKNVRELKRELARIKTKVETVKGKSLSSLFSKCSPDREFDWLRVSADHVVAHSAHECQRMWHLYVKPSVNKSKWTPREDSRLLELVEKYNKEDWDTIAKELETSRTGYQCFVNYQTRLNKGIKKLGKWTEEEDKALATLVAQCKVGCYIPWTKIAYYFEGRSLAQIYCRWNGSLNPDLKKGRFTRQEDKMIVSFVRKFGEDFSKISKMIGYRTSVQLRERYLRAIPVKYQNTGRWSLDEDKLLLSLVKKHGVSNWSAVSKQFVTRTRTQVRQRYSVIKRVLDKNPNFELEDFHRGPTALSQSTLPPVSCKIETETKDNLLADLIEKDQLEEAMLRKQNSILITRIRTGRKRIFKRSELDTKLINYFREAYTNETLRLKTHYIKPDVDKALNAIVLFCQFLQVHISLPKQESHIYKRLPLTLRNIIQVMQKRFTNWGCDCLGTSSAGQSCFCPCKEQNSIDCFPVDLKTTIVDDSDYLLSSILHLKKPTEVSKQRCNCFANGVKHFIPYYLPPNIMTCIGFRSTLLMKDKIAVSLSFDRRRSGYFPNDEVEVQNNGLKKFTGYFSDEGDSNSEEDDDADITPARKSNYETFNESARLDTSILSSTPSTSSSMSTSIPCIPKGKQRIPLKNDPMPYDPFQSGSFNAPLDSRESTDVKRLTAQEAINLWKERLMAVLGWPIVLSNQPPDFSSNFDSSEESEMSKKPSERDQGCSSQNIPQDSLLAEVDIQNRNFLASKAEKMPRGYTRGVKRKTEEIEDRIVGGNSSKMLCEGFNRRCVDNKGSNNEKDSRSTNNESSDPILSSVSEVQCNVEVAVSDRPVQEQSQHELNTRPNQSNDSSIDVTSSSRVVMDKVYRCYTRKKVRNNN